MPEISNYQWLRHMCRNCRTLIIGNSIWRNTIHLVYLFPGGNAKHKAGRGTGIQGSYVGVGRAKETNIVRGRGRGRGTGRGGGGH